MGRHTDKRVTWCSPLKTCSGSVSHARSQSGLHSFAYDGAGRLTGETQGLLQNNWAYTPAGVLGTYTRGALVVNGLTNSDNTTYQPALTAGLSALVAGTAYAVR